MTRVNVKNDYADIETDFEVRWEEGREHHPKSEELFEHLKALDFANEDYFNWKCGGDGDNGEELMYALDCYFERRDALEGKDE